MAKLMWDFFGPDAEGTARHYSRHLQEFLEKNQLPGCETGVTELARGHWESWCAVPAEGVDLVQRVLRPRRAQSV